MVTSSQIQLDSYPFQLSSFTGTVMQIGGQTLLHTEIERARATREAPNEYKIHQIATTTYRNDEVTLFVKSDDGIEKSFRFEYSVNVEARQGHRVTVSSLANSKQTSVAHIVNHSMSAYGYSYTAMNIIARKPISKAEWRLIFKLIAILLVIITISALIGLVTKSAAIIFLGVIVPLFATPFYTLSRLKKIQQEKAREYAKIIAEAIQS